MGTGVRLNPHRPPVPPLQTTGLWRGVIIAAPSGRGDRGIGVKYPMSRLLATGNNFGASARGRQAVYG